jgi:hypothetical protein
VHAKSLYWRPKIYFFIASFFPNVQQGYTMKSRIEAAAFLIRDADGLFITAGAGMGVDSGLPDFRGPNGFWGIYPALGREKLRFEDIACPRAFVERPEIA